MKTPLSSGDAELDGMSTSATNKLQPQAPANDLEIDLDIEILESLPAMVEQAGATTIPAHTLHEIARKLPDGAMISLTEEPGEPPP